MSPEIDSDKKSISKATGFEDFAFNANLREQPDESITIIDTEKASFKDHEVDVFSLLSSEKEYKFSLEQIQIFAELNDIFEPNAVIIIGEFLGYDFA
jgi:lantibiotic modifying enzyme